jgi:hypothetical protein
MIGRQSYRITDLSFCASRQILRAHISHPTKFTTLLSEVNGSSREMMFVILSNGANNTSNLGRTPVFSSEKCNGADGWEGAP